MCSYPGSNSGYSFQLTLQNSTAPLKRNEILEKSEVIQIPKKSHTTTGAIFVSSCLGLKPSSEPCIRIFFQSALADTVKYIYCE